MQKKNKTRSAVQKSEQVKYKPSHSFTGRLRRDKVTENATIHLHVDYNSLIF